MNPDPLYHLRIAEQCADEGSVASTLVAIGNALYLKLDAIETQLKSIRDAVESIEMSSD